MKYELNNSFINAMINNKPNNDLDKLVFLTDNEKLQEKFIACNCKAIYLEAVDINSFIDKIKTCSTSTMEQVSYLNNYLFLPLLNKSENIVICNSLKDFVRLDNEAFKILKNKNKLFYIDNIEFLEECINNYVDKTFKKSKDIDNNNTLSLISQEKNIDKTVFFTLSEADAKIIKEWGLHCIYGSVEEFESLKPSTFKTFNIILILKNNEEEGPSITRSIFEKFKSHLFSFKSGAISTHKDKGLKHYVEAEQGTKETFLNKVNQLKTHYPNWIEINDKDKLKIKASYLALLIKNNIYLKAITRKDTDKIDYYRYKNGVYEVTQQKTLENLVNSYIPIEYRSTYIIKEVVKLLQIDAPEYRLEDFDSDYNYINLRNGLYNVKERAIEPHTPNYLSKLQLNCNYDPNAKGFVWDKYLNDLCTDTETEENLVDYEKMKHLQQWFGVAISNIPFTKIKGVLCLFSRKGDTGKSIFLNTLTNLLGEEHISTNSLETLTERFSTSSLYGKRLNIIGDQRDTSLKDSSMFKMITGDDLIPVEFKGKTAFSFRFTGGLLFSCNNPPRFKDDKGEHMYSRLHILQFNNVIAEKQRDRNLLEKLKKELDYIFLWALEGLYMFINNSYTIPKSENNLKALKDFRYNNDHFLQFMDKYKITHKEEDKIKTSTLHKDYIEWCVNETNININSRYSPMLIKKILTDKDRDFRLICSKIKGEFYYKGITEIIEEEQGEEVEKEAKEIFKNVDAK